MTENLQTVKGLISKGEFFKAYDTAMQALQVQPDNTALKHRALLALANAGASTLAMTRFVELGLHESKDLDVQCLLARLHKDMGFASASETASTSFSKACLLYEQAWNDHQNSSQSYYPAINAAACAVFARQFDKARHWSGVVLRHLDKLPTHHADPIEQYWPLATRIEALLIHGDLNSAAALVEQAQKLAGADRTSLASTQRQLQRLCAGLGLDFRALGFSTPPGIIHYTGHLISKNGRFPECEEIRVQQEITHMLNSHQVGVAYGSLAGGADILFAESLLARGADLHVVLPFEPEEFLRVSVLSCGSQWAPRFERCLNSARSVRMATDDAYLDDDQLFVHCSQIAMGLAVLNARHLNTEAIQIGVWDGVQTRANIAGTEADLKLWSNTGLPQHIIHSGNSTAPRALIAEAGLVQHALLSTSNQGRSGQAMLFADVKGFSKLGDKVLPVFIKEVMGRLATVTQKHRDDLHSINTWGDGVFAVFNDVAEAAECALSMQESMLGLDRLALGLPEEISLRIGLHFGPVYLTLDPITQRDTAIGAHVSRAARIEPITPEGCVYVTETFAAVLAVGGQNFFACDYVGQTETAKNYGVMRMFLLRRTSDNTSTTVVVNFERE